LRVVIRADPFKTASHIEQSRDLLHEKKPTVNRETVVGGIADGVFSQSRVQEVE
jgi:hypothetical protein